MWRHGSVWSIIRGHGCSASLALFGETYTIGVTLEQKDHKRLDFLNEALSGSSISVNNLFVLAQLFRGGGREDRKFQVEALVAYWLSYFVFPSYPEDGLHSYVSSSPSYLSREKDWPWRPFTLTLYMPGSTSACATSSTQLVDMMLSLMLRHLSLKCFYWRDLSFVP